MLKSAHLIDPYLRTAVDTLPSNTLDAATLPALRASIADRFAQAMPPAEGEVAVDTCWVSRPDGGEIRVVRYRPRSAKRTLPAILHMHGGGFIMGAPEVADAQNRMLARMCEVAIYAVEYRLAPETVYPGQLDDAYAVLEWMNAQADAEGIDRATIGVKGESAGGALAAALALAVRDRGGPGLAFQLLIYPALDDRTGSVGDPHPYCGEYLWTPASNRFAWRALLGREPGGADTPAYAAPARAEDLTGLPPAFIAVGALDLYMEENLDYARRLSRAGNQIELHVYPGVIHGFGIVPGAWIESVGERDLREGLLRILTRRGAG